MSKQMDERTRKKLRAIYIFEAVILAYLAGTAVVQIIIVYYLN